ncbi:MAG TPA: MFS transporter [Burkholderiales bacterium]|nr:MFS transporter [Burkholderiales bacterium]
MELSKKNVSLLSACQALLLVNNSILITVNGLAGYALASNKTLATLPVTSYFLGSALSTLPVSLLMKRYGRRAGFSAGAACGMLGALLCAMAIYSRNFWLLCAGTLVLGIYFASGQYYRFAAAEVVPPSFKATAISLVLAGGIVGGFLGPETSKITRDLVAGHLYAGAYFSLVVFALLTILVVSRLEIPRLSAADAHDAGRPISQIARQPAFVVAVLCAVVGYGVMNLLMTGTPLAMVACQHPFSAAAFVIQWHMVGMFAPSFVTGSLIKRFGLLPIMIVGAILMGACVTVSLLGVDVVNFWIALVLLGVGWNFMYLGATTLLTETHTPAERGKVQGVNDMAVSFTMVLSSLSVGALFTYQGWQVMNALAAPFVAIAAISIVWLALVRRARPAAL